MRQRECRDPQSVHGRGAESYVGLPALRIHRLLKAAIENEQMSLTDVTGNVTEVPADLIIAFPAATRSRHIAYIVGYLALLARIDGEVEKVEPQEITR